MVRAPNQVIRKRMVSCIGTGDAGWKGCRHVDAKAMTCLLCRCNVRLKASLADSSCPIGMWDVYNEEEKEA